MNLPSAKRALRFDESLDILLLKIANFHDAHICRHGEIRAKFQKVADEFNSSPQFQPLQMKSCSWKTTRARTERLLKSFERSDKANRAKSGIDEDFSEKEILLSDALARENDFMEEMNGKKRGKEREEGLLEAAQELRESSLSRCKRGREEGDGNGEEARRVRRKKKDFDDLGDSEDPELSLMKDIEEKRGERELRSLEIQEKALQMQERNLEEARLERASREKIELERMRLEGKRLKRDSEDRKDLREALKILGDAIAKK